MCLYFKRGITSRLINVLYFYGKYPHGKPFVMTAKNVTFLALLLWCFESTSQSDCPNLHDSNDDLSVTVVDLLDLLIVYGDSDSDADGIWDSLDDCIDLEACNYDFNPTEPCVFPDSIGNCGGTCLGDIDDDGICDDVDDCIGEIDVCGVCNGPGPTDIIENISIVFDSVFVEAIDSWIVYEVADTTFTYVCADDFSACGDTVYYQGYGYPSVQIGGQCWFTENLRTAYFANGDDVPGGLNDSDWNVSSGGGSSVYGEDPGCYDYSPDLNACDSAQTLEAFGRLYNWYAVNDERGLCPNNWHVPSDLEWMELEMTLGMSEIEAMSTGNRGTDQGLQMKSTMGWSNGGNGTNSSGFSGLPGGRRDVSGFFFNAGFYGYWWTASSNGSLAWYRHLDSTSENVTRDENNLNTGYSVRCIRNVE